MLCYDQSMFEKPCPLMNAPGQHWLIYSLSVLLHLWLRPPPAGLSISPLTPYRTNPINRSDYWIGSVVYRVHLSSCVSYLVIYLGRVAAERRAWQTKQR